MAKERRGLVKKDSSLMFREISPPHKWDQDLHFHYLSLTLPGFANADITLHVDKYGGRLTLLGRHKITEHKCVTFGETFDVADDADLEQAEGFFQDEQIYCVAIPKRNQLGQRKEDGVKFDDGDHNKDKESEFMSKIIVILIVLLTAILLAKIVVIIVDPYLQTADRESNKNPENKESSATFQDSYSYLFLAEGSASAKVR